MADLTTTELAARLGVSRRRALALLAEEKISSRRLSNGTWLADANSVTRFERTAQRGSGRTLSSDAAWAVLWELSGLKVDWLSESTHARVRRRIRQSTASEIASVVAGRTKPHYFTAANAEQVTAKLIRTGRAASGTLAALNVDLIADHRRVAGYVREDTIADFAAHNFMIEKSDGADVLYENTLPFRFDEDVMPAAVVAADLSRSTDTRERAAGITAIQELKAQWLAR